MRQNVLTEETQYLIPGYSHHQSHYNESEILQKAYGNEGDSEWVNDKNPLYFQLTPDYKTVEPEVTLQNVFFSEWSSCLTFTFTSLKP